MGADRFVCVWLAAFCSCCSSRAVFGGWGRRLVLGCDLYFQAVNCRFRSYANRMNARKRELRRCVRACVCLCCCVFVVFSFDPFFLTTLFIFCCCTHDLDTDYLEIAWDCNRGGNGEPKSDLACEAIQSSTSSSSPSVAQVYAGRKYRHYRGHRRYWYSTDTTVVLVRWDPVEPKHRHYTGTKHF